jgi:hypothetical protein
MREDGVDWLGRTDAGPNVAALFRAAHIRAPATRAASRAGQDRAAEQAERNAAWLVAFPQKSWLKRNVRTRVPGIVTTQVIKVVIEEAAKTLMVPVSAIYESNIRNLLKNRQVVVRN